MEWVSPIIGGIFLVISGSIAAITAIRNVRNGAREQRAPDVTEAWTEAERARARLHVFEDLFYIVRSAFKGFARRAIEIHPDLELTAEEKTALEIKLPDIGPK